MFSFVSFIGERGYNGVGHLVDYENREGVGGSKIQLI